MSKFVRVGQEDPMATLCRMVLNTRYEDLPASAVNRAKESILDTIAVTIGGSAMEGIPVVVDLVKRKGGAQESFVPFYGGKVPASEAALAIGPMSRAMDMGDLHQEGGHCGEYILPAMLAATGLRGKITGEEFITAYIVAVEVLARIGMAYRTTTALANWRMMGHGIFACVAGVGRLLDFSSDELENAEGIALEMTQPNSLAMVVPGTLMVRVHHGFVAQDSINACLLARGGITGPRKEVMLGPRGYLSFAKWETSPLELTNRLGDQWEVENIVVKRYPTCGYNLTAVDGMIEQRQKHKFTGEEIAAVHLDVPPMSSLVYLPKEVKWNPRTAYECQFSLPYATATAAYDGDVFLDSYTPETMTRRGVRDLMKNITVAEDKSLPVFACRITTTLKDNRKFSSEHHKTQFTERPKLIDKFNKCLPYSAYKLSKDAVDCLVEDILALEKMDDILSALVLPLTPH